MNAQIEPTLTLEQVAEHFEQWRQGKRKGERIPEQLWDEALGLLDTYGISPISRTLRLSYTELAKRRGMIAVPQRREVPGGEPAFVEIDPALMDRVPQPNAGAVWMELERPDGLRLRIQPTHGVDLLALVDRFMGV